MEKIYCSRFFQILFLIGCISFSGESFAVEAQKTHREEKKYGFTTGFLSDPIGLFPLSFSYNLESYARLNIGGAFTPGILLGDAWTFGGGARFLVPGWNLTPALGLQMGLIHLPENADSSDPSWDLFSRDETENLLFNSITLGVEYQASGGFFVGLGGGALWVWPNSKPGAYPYISLGWFF